MIKINQLKLPIDHSNQDLINKIQKKLNLKSADFKYQILKRSIDARKKPELFYSYTIAVDVKKESEVLKRAKDKSLCLYKKQLYQLPECGDVLLKNRPVIVGAGPAGLFCAYILTEAGFCPIVIERGADVKSRTQDVKKFWETGILNPTSNVQFGEGGAGTFSDGKLNTSVKDPSGRNLLVLETFVRFGADSSILYDNKPHIGTDVLSDVIVNMRNYLIEHGCEFRFLTCLNDIRIENNNISSIIVSNKNAVINDEKCNAKNSNTKNSNKKSTNMVEINTSVCVIAPGHSARDTFSMLKENGLDMECKSFAVGFRVEHPQQMINEALYGSYKKKKLPAAPYKVTSNFPNGRGVYSFCMCPGGYVVNSSSANGQTVVNGMSYSGRNSSNSNSAIIVSVTPNDFGGDDALAGVRFQQRLEKENYERGLGKIPQQLFGDFCNNRESLSYGDFASVTKGATSFSKLNGLLNSEMEDSFIKGMHHFGQIISNFDRYDAILSGMETRTSSPLRIKRDEEFESNIKGIYPCGEGAGYAGGITSAAIDGIKTAEAIIRKYKK